MKARALCPTHITGFFEIRDESPDVLRKGSRGAGVCLALEVETYVETSDDRRTKIFVNGTPSDAEVSRRVAAELMAVSPEPRGLTIRHTVPVPIGSGFGTSGAGALGTALAGSEALGLAISPLQAAQLAHKIEVELKTGLGTVAGEFCGGLEVRAKEGAPGIGEVFRVDLEPDYSVVALHNGPMRTSELLSDRTYRATINSVGRAFCDQIIRNPDLDSFLRLSHKFSNAVALGTGVFAEVMRAAQRYGYLLGTAMFGHTLFTIARESEAREIAALFEESSLGQVIISRISPLGARLV